MKDNLVKEIAEIEEHLSSTPRGDKKVEDKLVTYIEECEAKYKPMVEEARKEIEERYNATLAKYKDLTFTVDSVDIDYDSLKLSDNRVSSDEKMNLCRSFYKLSNLTENNLTEVNDILNALLEKFKECGITLTSKDFNHSEGVNTYMNAVINKDESIVDVFNSIFWKTPDLIHQIELNFRYLYYKNKSKIDSYYAKKYAGFDFDNFIMNHKVLVDQNEMKKHNSVKYIYDLFDKKTIDPNEFISESKVQNLISTILVDTASERNYENLIKLKKTLIEYKGFLQYEYLIKDLKELYSKKEEYKDLFVNKLKDIAKKEATLVSLNKKISKNGIFGLKKEKKAATKNERNKLLLELYDDYQELDSLKIKDDIFKYFNDETNYHNMLKFVTYNYNYYVSLLVSQGESLNADSIEAGFLKLNKYLYDNEIDVINNIFISEDKDIAKIICDMYKLNSIVINKDSLSLDQIDNLITIVDKIAIYFDVFRLGLSLRDMEFIQEVRVVL